MLSDDDLCAIEERANKATLGPWVLSDVYWRQVPDQWFRRVCRATSNGGPSLSEVSLMPHLPDKDGKPRRDPQAEIDMEFIAHARTDVPALVAEVRRLRAWINRAPYSAPAEFEQPLNLDEIAEENLRDALASAWRAIKFEMSENLKNRGYLQDEYEKNQRLRAEIATLRAENERLERRSKGHHAHIKDEQKRRKMAVRAGAKMASRLEEVVARTEWLSRWARRPL